MPIIFIVDNDLARTRILSRSLRAAGYHTLPMWDAGMTVESMRCIRPDLILVNAERPEVGARRIVEEVRKDRRSRRTPILLTSCALGPDYRRLRRQVGVGEVLLRFESSVDSIIDRVRHFTDGAGDANYDDSFEVSES